MVEQQIRTWEVLNQRILDLFHAIPREDFVSRSYVGVAYADTNIPLGDGQFMLPPKVIARALQALNPQPLDRVLEIGTGSAYLTVLLAKLSAHVVSVEISQALHIQAASRLKSRGVKNVSPMLGDGAKGWDAESPYDVIMVTGSMPSLAPTLSQQLKVGGRLFVIVGRSPAMEALLVTRVGADAWSTVSLFETVVPTLAGIEELRPFKL
ncbi:MAG: methyltransferase domain-containing protein [Gammaproteobacteria bacterium]|nr:methyltransferase domain-containing protein [Gammaproteobacteria bacterium]